MSSNWTRKASSLWSNCSSRLLELLYPTRCPLCGLLSDNSPCLVCESEFRVRDARVQFLDEGPLVFRAALYEYTGRAAQAVRKLKYSRSTSLASRMAHLIGSGVDELGIECDIVVPVPIHWVRRCHRGFNQAELLASRLPNVEHSLKRVRLTRPQVGLAYHERILNLQGAFAASPAVGGKTVLLIDDVLTTGQTARECATALLAANAKEVGILAFCGEP